MKTEEERRRLDLPDRRKHTYDSLATLIDEHIDRIEDQLQKWIRRSLIAMSIIAIACVLALIGYGLAIHSIQGQRHTACQDQNDQHDRTIRLFRVSAEKIIRQHPEQKRAVRDSFDINIRIINALAPKRNCDKVAPQGGLFP